ncbi:MAG: hypothetical protein ACLFN2_00085 [Bacteroidales bacterium]
MQIKHLFYYTAVLLIFSILFVTDDSFQRQVSGQIRRGQSGNDPEGYEMIYTLRDSAGPVMEVVFQQGRAHNHPLMAVWIEDSNGNYIQTLFVAESIGRGVFRHGDSSDGRWKPGPIRRPAALPYWSHQRGIRAEDGYYLPTHDNPVPDAITGPTPKGNFILHSRASAGSSREFIVLLELNQSWDWNEYWTNNKFPGDEHYMSSSQPALVYMVSVDLDNGISEYELLPAGHSHWSGQNGNLYEDLETITTALDIAETIMVRFPD